MSRAPSLPNGRQRARVAEGVQLIAESEDRAALEQLAEKAERKTIRRAASRRLEALG